MSDWLPFDADRAWLGPALYFALVAAKRLLDATLPPGSRFRFTSRWLQQEPPKKKRRRRDDDE